jgi:hypothetical protein
MSIQGFLVALTPQSYETPNCCASCLGPRETELKARLSEKSGNIRTTLTMAFPYCNACAKRAKREKIRQILVGLAAALTGAALALAAWRVDLGPVAPIRFAIALPLAAAVAALVALLTRQSIPAPPATARGEAVILQDTRGTVLCTNPQFAQHLAQANGGPATPGAQHLTVEVWAPITALLVGALVAGSWIKVGAPHATATASASPASDPAATPPRKPAPAAPAKKH